MQYTAHKRFVSLFFTSNKMQVVYLSSDKKSVEKFATFDIPNGIISSRKVVDQAKLAEILIGVWQKLGLKEKFVGIVVPEFSTYIKAIEIPKIEMAELNEAVNWQAADVMPTSQAETALDWKIIEESDCGYTILVASIRKDVLEGYVSSVAKAGLLPLVLETPSLSLSRVSNHENLGKIVVYQSFEDAIIIVAKKENIFGSSIAGLGDDNVISTALRIGHYYSGVKIERVVVGGINITRNLMSVLQEKFSIGVEWIQVNLSGMTAQQLQEYMIPISLAFKEPQEPRDENSINLLPMDWAKNYELKSFKSKLRKLLIDTYLVVLMLLLISGGFYMSLLVKSKNLAKSIDPTDVAKAQEYAKKAQEVNMLSDKVIKIDKRSTQMGEVISLISQARSGGIDIKKIVVNFDTKNVEINGFSFGRLDLIEFKKNLDETGKFENINVPLSILEKDSDIDFSISTKLKVTADSNTGVIKLPADFVKQ